jgi:glycosyltransferase involved in cell wall biosynthesis
MILLISAVFPPEPVVSASMTYDLALALSRIWEVMVITPKPSRPFGFSFKKGSTNNIEFEHIVLNSFTYPKSKIIGRLLESYSFGKHAANYIRKNRTGIDCIYVNTWPFLAQYLIIKAAKKYSIPSVIHVQDIYPESLANKIPIIGIINRMILLPMDIFILKNVSRIVAISDNMLNTFVQTRGISEDKIEIVQNWQDESEFIKRHELKVSLKKNESAEKLFVFMYLGNIGPVAGVDFLIESFVKADLKRALLIIAGSGSKKNECIKIAESYKSQNIKFCEVPMGRVPEIQEQADVMLLPVKSGASMSSIPSKLPAYMFSGKPILASIDEESDTATSIKQAKCGWVVPPEDIDALSKTMKILVSTPEVEMKNFGRNGFKYAMEKFSKERNLQKMICIINEVANETSLGV